MGWGKFCGGKVWGWAMGQNQDVSFRHVKFDMFLAPMADIK